MDKIKVLNPIKYKGDQINFVNDKGLQWIEINRGCLRGCTFCHADSNYKEFPVPEILSNKVHIIGEGLLYDSKIKEKIIELGNKRVNNKVVYYGLSQGVDYRLLSLDLVNLLSKNRFGLINSKGNWYKGIRIAWDFGKAQEKYIKNTIEMLVNAGYIRKMIMVFMLVNWKIDFKTCFYKFMKCQEWGVRIDDCTWECTKKNFIPMYWKEKNYRIFRKMVRQHNIDMLFKK